jgi:hypothetical protein
MIVEAKLNKSKLKKIKKECLAYYDLMTTNENIKK